MDVVPGLKELIYKRRSTQIRPLFIFVFAGFSTFRQDRSFRSRLAEDFEGTGHQLAFLRRLLAPEKFAISLSLASAPPPN